MRIWAFPSFYPIDHPGERYHGIFAHRQYKGLIESKAELKVIAPVVWYPIFPFYLLNKQWTALSKIKYPHKRIFDGIEVFHPRRANMKPSRLFNKHFDQGYIDAIVNFFKKNKIILDPANDVFLSQWIVTARMVQEAAHQLGVKSAVMGIGDDVNIWPNKNESNLHMFQKTWREADYRLAVAGYIAEAANKLCNQKLPYHVIRRGVDHNFFKPADDEEKQKLRKKFKFPDDKIIILTIGSAIVNKGWLDLFDALQKMKGHNSNFLLAGVHSGPSNLNLDAEAEKRGISEVFMNFGEMAPTEIHEIYNASDIFCLPSHWEGIANVVVEAMSCGLPVVTTNVCGHPELVRSGTNGILVPPKRPDLLINELEQLLNNAALRKEIGENARNFIINEWGSFAQNSAKLYNILSAK